MDRIQNIGTRTFYRRDSQWVDNETENRDLKTVKIKQFSNAHFKLLAAYPELNRYQRLGNARLLVNNQALEIGPEGKEDLTDTELKEILGTAGRNVKSSAAPTAPAALAFGGFAAAAAFVRRSV